MSKVIADMSLGGTVGRQVLDDAFAEAGAVVVGRGMFDDAGGWGYVNPFPFPVFVLTDRVDDELPAKAPTFTFVTGVDEALAQARAAAGDQNVVIGGGADVIRQFLAAGLVDELAAPFATQLRYHVIH